MIKCDTNVKKGTGKAKKGTETPKKGTGWGLKKQKRGLSFSYLRGLRANSPLFLKIIN